MLRFDDYLILELKYSVQDIYDKWYGDLDKTTFDQIVSADPTSNSPGGNPMKMGKYSKWLIDKYQRGQLLLEDLYKATEYLELFQTNKHLIKKAGLELDINKYKNLNDLYDIVDTYQVPKEIKDESALLTNKYFLTTGEAEKFYEDEDLFVVITHTHEANIFYGCDSKWCTTKGYFDQYKNKGHLYVLIDKKNLNTNNKDRRVQFHFETNSFMDMNDAPAVHFLLAHLEKMRGIFGSIENYENLEMKMINSFNSLTLSQFYDKKDFIAKHFPDRVGGLEKSIITKFIDSVGNSSIADIISGMQLFPDDKLDLIGDKLDGHLLGVIYNNVRNGVDLSTGVDKYKLKSHLLKNAEQNKDLTGELILKLGLNLEEDNLFLTAAPVFGFNFDDLPYSDADKKYMNFITSGDFSDEALAYAKTLTKKQMSHVLLHMIDNMDLRAGREFLMNFKPNIEDIRRKNDSTGSNRGLTLQGGMWSGYFEKKGFAAKLDMLLDNSRILSYQHWTKIEGQDSDNY